MTLYRALSNALTNMGFKRTSSENQTGVHRTWWKGPKYNVKTLVEFFKMAEFKAKYSRIGQLDAEIIGVGWSFSPPDNSDIDSDWCLSVYKNNKLGELEAKGFDTSDLQMDLF